MAAVRFDTSSWLASAVLIGDDGFGVIGSLIPSTGEEGAGYAYNDLALPADAAKEICGRLTTFPSAGVLAANEDTSGTFSGAPDGTYTAQYQLYVDGVAVGSPATITFTIGPVDINPAVGALTITGPAPTVTQISSVLNFTPGAGQLHITGPAPKVTQTVAGQIGGRLRGGQGQHALTREQERDLLLRDYIAHANDILDADKRDEEATGIELVGIVSTLMALGELG